MGKFFGSNSQFYNVKNRVLEFRLLDFRKNHNRKFFAKLNSLGFLACRVALVLVLVVGVGCSSLAVKNTRNSWKIGAGMSRDGVVEVMGLPMSELSNRLLYEVKYSCKKLPFYVSFSDGIVVQWGIPRELMDLADRHCDNARQNRQAGIDAMQKTLILGATHFGPKPSEMGQRLQPIMQNCWEDPSGWHCM